MSTEIQTVKNQTALKNWAEEVAECQSSGLKSKETWKYFSATIKLYENGKISFSFNNAQKSTKISKN